MVPPQVHQFLKTERGWCERLVDVAEEGDARHLRLVLAPGATPASRLLLPLRLAGLPPAQRAAPPGALPGVLRVLAGT